MASRGAGDIEEGDDYSPARIGEMMRRAADLERDLSVTRMPPVWVPESASARVAARPRMDRLSSLSWSMMGSPRSIPAATE